MFGVLGAGPVMAAPPTPVDPKPSTWTCPKLGEVNIQLSGKEKIIELPDGGSIITAPNQRVKITAPNGNTVSYVVTGASHVTVQEDGDLEVTATGRNVLRVPKANGHESGLFLTRGSFTYILNPDFSEQEIFSGLALW